MTPRPLPNRLPKKEIVVAVDSVCAGCGGGPKRRFDGVPMLYLCAEDGPLVCSTGCHRRAMGDTRTRYRPPRAPGARYQDLRRQIQRMRDKRDELVKAIQLMESNGQFFDLLFEVELWFEKRRNRRRSKENRGILITMTSVRDKYHYMRPQDFKYDEGIFPNPALPIFMQKMEAETGRALTHEEVRHIRHNEIERIRARWYNKTLKKQQELTPPKFRGL